MECGDDLAWNEDIWNPNSLDVVHLLSVVPHPILPVPSTTDAKSVASASNLTREEHCKGLGLEPDLKVVFKVAQLFYSMV